MKLTKLFLVLASFSALLVATGGVALADPPSFTVTASVLSNCILSTPGNITFGSYDPLAADATPGTADLTIACTIGQKPKISLSYGVNSGSGSYNYMKASKTDDTLQYQIFQPTGPKPAGQSANQWNGKTLTGAAATDLTAVSYTMYGVLPPNQNKPADTYTDTVTVTVEL